MYWSDFINTVRLKLRCVAESDLALLAYWAKCANAYGDYLSPEGYDEKQLIDRLANGRLWNKDKRLYLIEKRSSGCAVGSIQYWKKTGPDNGVVISLKIAEPSQRGKGYGTEAQKYLIIQLFEHTDTNVIEMYTDINNIAQQKCLAKLGFEVVNSLNYDDYHVMRIGYLYRLTKDNYSKKGFYKYHDI
ncbi:MAG: GNAT family N-acetyltransferase [Desulfotalea sp.]